MVTQPRAGVTAHGRVEHLLRRVDNVRHRGSPRMSGACVRPIDDSIHRGNLGLYRLIAGKDAVDVFVTRPSDLA